MPDLSWKNLANMQLSWIGAYTDLQEVDAHMGDVAFHNGETFVYTGQWEPLGDNTTTAVRSHPTNCHNCGAVLTGYVCEFCGTEYF